MSTFIIFTDDIVEKSFSDKESKKELTDFFKEIAGEGFGCVFLPENHQGFFDKMDASAFIQLGFPTIVKVRDLMENGSEKISFSGLNKVIRFKKAEMKKGAVIALAEENLESFGKGFDLFLVDRNKTPGHNGQYQTINNLADILPILRQK